MRQRLGRWSNLPESDTLRSSRISNRDSRIFLTATQGNLMSLTEIHNQTFANAAVEMDGKRFSDCVFINCVLRYIGKDPCQWENTKFDDACVWKFDGCALNLIRVLRAIGLLRFPFRTWRTELDQLISFPDLSSTLSNDYPVTASPTLTCLVSQVYYYPNHGNGCGSIWR